MCPFIWYIKDIIKHCIWNLSSYLYCIYLCLFVFIFLCHGTFSPSCSSYYGTHEGHVVLFCVSQTPAPSPGKNRKLGAIMCLS